MSASRPTLKSEIISDPLIASIRFASRHAHICFHWAYSGRGMYGDTCIGVAGEFHDLLTFLALIADEDMRIFLVENLSRESFGSGEVWYWTHLSLD